jgi:predicted amidophosphoribosyltransferase
VTEIEAPPDPADETLQGAHACLECGQAMGPSQRFCPACGGLKRAGRSLPQRAEAVAARDPSAGARCFGCGAPQGEEPAQFCRACGQGLRERQLIAGQLASHSGGRPVHRPGFCHGCGAALPAESRFCGACGTASRLARVSPADRVARDPGWYKVVRGLALVYEGHVTVVAAAISATAVMTVLGLFAADWSQLGALRAALLGAAALAGLVGLVLAVAGEVVCLAAPAESKVRLPALVTLALGGAAATLGALALILMGSVGFDTARLPAGAATLGALALLLFIAHLVAFSTMLRQMAFALQHYRIAQGSVGFIVFIGVGLAATGLINLLFQSARPSAQTFAQLLAVAFALLVAFWYLSIVKHGRDFVRQRLL